MKDVEALNKEGQKIFYIEKNTIITPAAKDAANNCGIKFSYEKWETSSEPVKACDREIDSTMIFTVLKAMMDKGLLKGLFDNGPGPPYQAEHESGGLKLVRGNTVKYDVFDTKNPTDKVYFQELISDKESSISAGLMTIETSSFQRELAYEEIDYVIEGTLTVTINGNTFTAYCGDVIYVPSGTKVTWGSPDKAKVFYTTYPAKLSDRIQK